MKTKKAIIHFMGVHPDGDDCTGHWGLIDRHIIIPFDQDNPTNEQVLQSLKEGNFTIQIEEDDKLEYIEDVLKQDNIVGVATSSITYEKFYKEMLTQLHKVGYDAYVEEFGKKQEDEDEDYRVNEFFDENGVNGEGFAELMYLYSNSDILFED